MKKMKPTTYCNKYCFCILLHCISLSWQLINSPNDCNSVYDSYLRTSKIICQLDAINVRDLKSDFSKLGQIPHIPVLQIICSSHYFDSSFEEVQFNGSLLNTQRLSFQSCRFNNVPNSVFQTLKRLENLEISDSTDPSNMHLEISVDAFKGLTNLKILKLYRNGIEQLPDRFLCDMPNLQYLVLSDNNITNTEVFGSDCNDKAICDNKLIYLDLSGNGIETFGNFCAIPNLKYLILTRNNISSLPDTFLSIFTNLTNMNLSRNRLSSFPDFKHNPYLLSVNLSYNNLVDVPAKSFEHFPPLTSLDLSHNEISSLNNKPFQTLYTLESLNLDNNKLISLSSDVFKHLTKVTLITISNNLLQEIHNSTFENNKVLNTLDLSSNHLTKFPNLENSNVFQVLDLTDNRIESVTNTHFSAVTSLWAIALKRNRISKIEKATFSSLLNISVINLAFNQITEIEKGSFDRNEQLQYLRLDHNFLSSIKGIFRHYIPSVYLNLSYNSLSQLDFSDLPFQLNEIDISHNFLTQLTDATGILLRSSFKYIYLSHNKLQHLSKRIVPPHTVRFDVSFNNLSHVDDHAFDNLERLTFVDLEGNSLKTIQLNSLRIKHSKDSGRPTIRLGGNIFFCDCNTVWLRDINLESKRKYLYVEDLNTISCKRRYAKYSEPYLNLTSVPATDDFLCPFANFTATSCYTHRNVTKCDYTCPEKCNCYRDQSWSYVIVDCEDRNLTEVPSHVPVLVSRVELQRNHLQQLDEHSFEDLPKLRFLHLNDNLIWMVKDGTFQSMMELKELYLNGNKIQSLSKRVFTGLSNLSKLHLHNNHIFTISNNTFAPLTSLQELRLAGNRLSTWPVWALDPVPSRLTLSKNPWSCDCNHMTQYRLWLQDSASSVMDSQDIECTKDDNKTMPLMNCVTMSTTNKIQDFPLASQIPLLAGIIAAIVVIITIIILALVFRQQIQMCIYLRYGVSLFKKTEDGDEDKEYDAFISYSNDDEDFTVNILAPGLQGKDGDFKLCLHHRDLVVGPNITESMMEAMERSRRIILVLSENFFKSEWCRCELKTVYLQMMKDRRNRVILIAYGGVPNDLDPEMKLYLKTNKYLGWGDRWFWQKLRFAMPTVTSRDQLQKQSGPNDINLVERT